MAETTLDKPLTGDPAQTVLATTTPEFAPDLPAVPTTEDINEAMSEPTTLPAPVERSLEVGQLGRVEGTDGVFLRTGTGEIREFTSPEALHAAGFDWDDVRLVL